MMLKGVAQDGKILGVGGLNLSHARIAEMHGVLKSATELTKGAEAFTVIVKGGKITVMGSPSFGGTLKVSDAVIKAATKLVQ
jgi:hypothetical protein